jgi:uncharacterized membrane protein YbjE (DUF340 family)
MLPTMTLVLLLMLAGIVVGFGIHRYPTLVKLNDKLVSGAIYILLFLLGISVGSNQTIVHNLEKIGLQALIITIGAVSGSILALWFVFRYFFQTEKQDQP